MTQAISVPTRRFGELRVVGPIYAAHFVSHYYMIMLAPLFAFVRADYGVSYRDLALALTAFNVVSAVLQTPAGFLVDRVGARLVLIAGVTLGAIAFAVVGIVDSFVVFIAMYAVAGLGNTAYHPADYSLLSDHSTPARISQIFSFHTFSGILGGAVAPATVLMMQARFGWRGAYLGAAVLGLAVLTLLISQRPTAADRLAEKRRRTPAPGSA
ncbi:MAG: MFS transporter, partial [Xanthobacteraceae bacterium]